MEKLGPLRSVHWPETRRSGAANLGERGPGAKRIAIRRQQDRETSHSADGSSTSQTRGEPSDRRQFGRSSSPESVRRGKGQWNPFNSIRRAADSSWLARKEESETKWTN